jgi:hypothetical protein
MPEVWPVSLLGRIAELRAEVSVSAIPDWAHAATDLKRESGPKTRHRGKARIDASVTAAANKNALAPEVGFFAE